ncbi:hypothetical protein [Streptomyces sp. 2A115]|uniref:hypothetical protein n=1 Tax=Streptomyces sp. 2A115 TaxID=3457439 RepID=UPI003FD38F95
MVGVIPAADLMDGLDHDQLTHRWLNAEPSDPDMTWLSGFPDLRVLRVNPRLPRVRNVPEGVRITAWPNRPRPDCC